MRALAVALLAAASCLLAVEGAAAARSPRLEKIALRAGDSRRASDALVKLSDLVSGWKGGAVKATNNSTPDCAFQNFSRYTITGQAESDYHQGGTLLISIANVFPSDAQSLGDFGVSTRTGTARCEGEAFRKALGSSAHLVSARQTVAPKVGQRAAAYEFVLKFDKSTYYADVILFIRGRALGALLSVNPGRPLAGPRTLARVMDGRLQLGTA
jgi:hypothetical protein